MNESEEVQRHGRQMFQKFLTERITELDEAIAESKAKLDVLEDKVVASQMKTLFTEIDQVMTDLNNGPVIEDKDGN
jgi:hypothetical protein